MKHFYHHVIEIDPIHIGLSGLDLSKEEKEHLAAIIEINIHHTVVDTILSELANEDKKTFLALIAKEELDHNKIWDFLTIKVDQAESKIKDTIEVLIQKMHTDIQEIHEKSKK